MNSASFKRKLFYIIAIVALLVPVYFLGQPMIHRKGAMAGEGGGTLSKIRQSYNIGQADLGDIDPASESMRLATLGFRGFATTILWHKADFYKREQFWDRYSATLNQIALLQPHFLNVWDHQAHNLTYNISVEFDGYKQRYEWVKKGIDYLIKGTSFNKRQPILQWTLGIYTGQKIGVADEKRQYRELYRNDDVFHNHLIEEGLDVKQSEALGADGKPDHWLSGRLWFLKAYDLVEAGYYCKKSPHLFYSDGPKTQMRYSEAIEEEGVLDDRAQFSWSRASEQWREFGNRDIMTTWGHNVKLKGDAAANANLIQLFKQFFDFAGDVRQGLLAKIRDQLNPPEQKIFDLDPADRTMEQQSILGSLGIPLEPTPLEIAAAAPKDRREKAIEMATQVRNATDYLNHLNAYRQQVNYEYWETRAISEQHRTTITARQQMFTADKLLQEAKLDQALVEYDKAWVNWAKVFRRFPLLMNDDVAGDITKSIRRYKRILDAPLPESFPLTRFYEFRKAVDSNSATFDSTAWLDVLKRASVNLPESDDDLPGNLNDFKAIEEIPLTPATDAPPIPGQDRRGSGASQTDGAPMVTSPEKVAAPVPGASAPEAPVPSDTKKPEAKEPESKESTLPANRPPQLEAPVPLG